MNERLDMILFKINYKLDILLEAQQKGLKAQVRQGLTDILFPRKESKNEH